MPMTTNRMMIITLLSWKYDANVLFSVGSNYSLTLQSLRNIMIMKLCLDVVVLVDDVAVAESDCDDDDDNDDE